MDFIQELSWRGLIQQTSDPSLAEKMRAEPFTLYVGFDPTADSLHVGSLVPLLALVRAQKAGHKPIAVVGGATGMIGDPSGKSAERKLLSADDLAQNLAGLQKQISRYLDLKTTAVLENNYDWFKSYNYLEFLRDIGKHFSVNMMMSKESVRARLEDRDQGISYTEFSYMLIQAYDFLVLHDRHNCRLQVGGSDQWGNITAGIELIRRLRSKEVFGLTMPLVLKSSGEKFGKSEGGNVWLDPARTSVYDFFQFFFRVEDADVGRFLRYFTMLDEPTIVDLEKQVQTAPQKREAQRVLAREVTRFVHGDEESRKAEEAAAALFGSKEPPADLKSLPHTELPRASLPMQLKDALVKAGLAKSRSDAHQAIEGKGVYVNGERVEDVKRSLGPEDLTGEGGVVLQRGKRDKHVLLFV